MYVYDTVQFVKVLQYIYVLYTKIRLGNAVFCPGLKKGMVLLEEKGHFCSRNYILRALSRA